MSEKQTAEVFRTGLPAIDTAIIPEGIPLRSLNVIGGEPGTGKTLLALQMLFANASPTNRAIYFTTISEPSVKFLSYLQNFDFYDADKMFSSIVVRDIGDDIQTKPLEEVIRTINEVIDEENARIVVIDSFKAISDIVPQADELRIFAYNLAVNLVSSMCTAFLVGEYTPKDTAEVPIFAIADGIMFLSFRAEGLNRHRYLEVHKVRGRRFFQGMHPFTIYDDGITVYPRIRTPEAFVDYDVASDRVHFGLPRLDEMVDGGLPRGTATMVAGGAGTGKSLMGLHFITNGVEVGEPGAIITFQENPTQLRQIASSFGWDLAKMEKEKMLAHLYQSPVEIQPDIHTELVKQAVARVGAKRVLIDSLKDLEIATPDKVRFRDYIYSLVDEFKRAGITVLFTNEIPELFGTFQISEFGISFIADNVILLRYVEMGGYMSRALSVLKVRGSQHSKEIREFTINNSGISVAGPIDAVTGIMGGMPVLDGSVRHRDISPVGQYLLRMLSRYGASELDELHAYTGLELAILQEQLAALETRGLVINANRKSGSRYQAVL